MRSMSRVSSLPKTFARFSSVVVPSTFVRCWHKKPGHSSNSTASAPSLSVANKLGLLPSQFTSASHEEISLELVRPFKGHKLEKMPSNTVKTTRKELLEYFAEMAYYRRLELVCDNLYKQRQIRGFCHLYDGQEAVVVGLNAALKADDSVITAYRDHPFQVARGGSTVGMMAELMGKVTGCSKGKGGSMHLYNAAGKFYGGNGIVGAQVPLGAGLAFKHWYTQDGHVSVALYGDGAANQGQISEALNMAALWKLPLILMCENNQYAMGTSCARGAASQDYYTRGDYIPGIWIDGMDVLASREGVRFAAEHCRSGKGPIMVEMSTYRYHGHSMSDPGISYRSRDEINKVRAEKDCILLVRKRLLNAKWATEQELKSIEKHIRQKVDEETVAAQSAPNPTVDTLLSDIYTEEPGFVRTVEFSKSKC